MFVWSMWKDLDTAAGMFASWPGERILISGSILLVRITLRVSRGWPVYTEAVAPRDPATKSIGTSYREPAISSHGWAVDTRTHPPPLMLTSWSDCTHCVTSEPRRHWTPRHRLGGMPCFFAEVLTESRLWALLHTSWRHQNTTTCRASNCSLHYLPKNLFSPNKWRNYLEASS